MSGSNWRWRKPFRPCWGRRGCAAGFMRRLVAVSSREVMANLHVDLHVVRRLLPIRGAVGRGVALNICRRPWSGCDGFGAVAGAGMGGSAPGLLGVMDTLRGAEDLVALPPGTCGAGGWVGSGGVVYADAWVGHGVSGPGAQS